MTNNKRTGIIAGSLAAAILTVWIVSTHEPRPLTATDTATTATVTTAPSPTPEPSPEELPVPPAPQPLAAIPVEQIAKRRSMVMAPLEVVESKKVAFVFSNIPDQLFLDGSKRCAPWCDVRAGDVATFTMTRAGIVYRTAQIKLNGPPNKFRVVVIGPDLANVGLSAWMTRTRWNGVGAMPEWAARINAEGADVIAGTTTEAVGARVWDAQKDGPAQ